MIIGDDGFYGDMSEMWADIDNQAATQAARDKKHQDRKDRQEGTKESRIRRDKIHQDQKDARQAARDLKRLNKQKDKDALAAQQALDALAVKAEQDQKDQDAAQLEQHLTDLQEYALDEHGVIPGDDITPENYPWLAFTKDGQPALFEDTALAEKLGLPDHVKAIQQQNGVVHTAWEPNEIMPAFAGTLDAGHTTEILAN
jgi:hypothetical protein